MNTMLKKIPWNKEVSDLGFTRNNVAFWFLTVFMIFLPIGEIIGEVFVHPSAGQAYIVALWGIIGVCFFLYVFVQDLRQKKIYPYEIFYLLLILFAAISYIFAVEGFRPPWIQDYRELPIHFLAYYSLMFMGAQITETKSRRMLLKVFVIVALIQCGVALFQTFGLEIAYCRFDADWHTEDALCYGLTQHNNFFAGLSILFTGVSSGLFLFFCKSKKAAIAMTACFVLSLYCSLCTGARIAWVGNVALVFFYLISILIVKHHGYDKAKLRSITRRALLLLVVAVVVTVCIGLFTDYFMGGWNDFVEQGFGENMASNRITIWKYGLETVPSHWLTGLGLDHYGYSFFLRDDWKFGMWYQDKGHNEYIHTLVTEGVFAFANYIALLVYACRKGIKSVLDEKDEKRRYVAWILTGMFAGYAAQALFNSSVMNIVVYFWIVIGLLMPVTEQKAFALKFCKRRKNGKRGETDAPFREDSLCRGDL